MDWCEQTEGVDYILGLARNTRLAAEISDDMAATEAEVERTGASARTYRDFRCRTQSTWSRERRVVGKAELLVGKRCQATAVRRQGKLTNATRGSW